MRERKVIKQDRYIIRKYVMAKSANEAIRKEKTTPVQDVWIDDEWKSIRIKQLTDCVGFTVDKEQSDSFEEGV